MGAMSTDHRPLPADLVARHQATALDPDNVLRTAEDAKQVGEHLFGSFAEWRFGLSVNL